MGRIYIFTGKGGVGKSSIAAAHAIRSAQGGKKTLLVSTDAAHNLGDIFERRLGKEPENVLPNLDVYEIDPEYVCLNDYQSMMEAMNKLLPEWNTEGRMDMGMMPGTDELFALLKISDLHKKGEYERIIVDCAPTGETLSLLKFPELLSWYMEKLFPIGKVGVRLLAPVAKMAYKVELPNQEAMNDIERLYLKLHELQELFKDRDITSIRIVTLPEKMVVEETKRNYMYMNLYNFNVDGIYINRILPEELKHTFFDEWLALQKEYIAQIKDCFGALPIYEIPWYDEELKGQQAIERIVREVLDEEEVFEAKEITQRETFMKNEQGYRLDVFLPNAEKGDMDLYQSATDVVIKLGNFKRNIPLPNVLRSYNITGAKFHNQVLAIQFEKNIDTKE